jgi:hypothetical protein
VVVKDDEVVRDAEPHVSEADPNYPQSDEGVVKVRSNDRVMLRIDLWEEQQRQRRLDKQRLREIDPFRLGHWSGDAE